MYGFFEKRRAYPLFWHDSCTIVKTDMLRKEDGVCVRSRLF
jgi:hypothetical protein